MPLDVYVTVILYFTTQVLHFTTQSQTEEYIEYKDKNPVTKEDDTNNTVMARVRPMHFKLTRRSQFLEHLAVRHRTQTNFGQ